MSNPLRLAGAQIDCTTDINQNINNIKNAIDWAANNTVDYILTPEGSLTGYFPKWDSYDNRTINNVYLAEKEVVKYAQEKNVGLCLGTMWGEEDTNFSEGYRKENQIRFYSKEGKFIGSSNKTYTIPEYDQTVPNSSMPTKYLLPFEHSAFEATGLICNDFWGGTFKNLPSLPLFAGERLKTHVIFHATNGFRGKMPNYDEITDIWHEGNLRMTSYNVGIPIITADSSCTFEGKQHKTSSTSGILLNGIWVAKAPRIGTHYFYYDFDFNNLINLKLKKHPDYENE